MRYRFQMYRKHFCCDVYIDEPTFMRCCSGTYLFMCLTQSVNKAVDACFVHGIALDGILRDQELNAQILGRKCFTYLKCRWRHVHMISIISHV
ncbi:hypothetical protein CEXT_625031 [Caerostris extrusa]|uniref:Uncharacterized protein n=1 Tax=Caerostris extrusa TaxID=172846 RepID=A0AAV4RVU3_CAEEX|nr:hypothetical protein CEXT_625031 [Caerostris extrusa]